MTYQRHHYLVLLSLTVGFVTSDRHLLPNAFVDRHRPGDFVLPLVVPPSSFPSAPTEYTISPAGVTLAMSALPLYGSTSASAAKPNSASVAGAAPCNSV